MINKNKYFPDGYKLHLPKCHISIEPRRKKCFVDTNQICTIERSLGNFERVSEEIEKESSEECAKVMKLKKII